jgi:hypothetical protein
LQHHFLPFDGKRCWHFYALCRGNPQGASQEQAAVVTSNLHFFLQVQLVGSGIVAGSLGPPSHLLAAGKKRTRRAFPRIDTVSIEVAPRSLLEHLLPGSQLYLFGDESPTTASPLLSDNVHLAADRKGLIWGRRLHFHFFNFKSQGPGNQSRQEPAPQERYP